MAPSAQTRQSLDESFTAAWKPSADAIESLEKYSARALAASGFEVAGVDAAAGAASGLWAEAGPAINPTARRIR